MMKKYLKKVFAIAVFAAAAFAMMPLASFPQSTAKVSAAGETVSGRITCDGSVSDWKDVPKIKSNDKAVDYWKAAQDEEGNLYVCFTGTAVSEWYGDYQWKYLKLVQNGSDKGFQIANAKSQTGGELSMKNEANGNNSAPYYVELKVPASYIKDKNYTLEFAGTSVKASEVPSLGGEDVAPGKKTEYDGIKIDGEFDDWDPVKKYDASCPNKDHKNCLSKAAMVFDGDHVYIYVEEGKGGSAAGAGAHSNGNFEIRTDLGRTMLLHFHNDGTVTSSSSNDIKSRHVGSRWEVSVPKKDLPSYEKNLSFGLYAASDEDFSPFVSDVANLDGSGGNSGSFSGITYDGMYGDWSDYPHDTIEYATSGTQEERVDAKGALYYPGDGKIFGHVVTTMPQHRQEHGGEFAYSVTIRVNKDKDKVFYPRLVAVDSSGNINWDPSFAKDGTYEYYIVDTQGWTTAKTLDDLKDGKHGNAVYGKMTMTLKADSKDECEFYIDSAQLAKKVNVKEADIKYVEAKFGRIGQQWLQSTGASTDPWLGVLICVGVVAAVLIYRKYRGKKREKPDEA